MAAGMVFMWICKRKRGAKGSPYLPPASPAANHRLKTTLKAAVCVTTPEGFCAKHQLSKQSKRDPPWLSPRRETQQDSASRHCRLLPGPRFRSADGLTEGQVLLPLQLKLTMGAGVKTQPFSCGYWCAHSAPQKLQGAGLTQ